ncbi:MAG: hypothetical protein ABIG28_02750 [archaeon]
MNKRGLAEVIGAISLIMIATVAAVMVAGYMNNFFFSTEVMFSSSASCLEMQTSLTAEIKNACYNSETGDVEVRVARKLSSIEIYELGFNVAGENYNCGIDCSVCELLENGETKSYYFEMGDYGAEGSGGAGIIGEKVILHVGGCVLDEAEIRGEC